MMGYLKLKIPPLLVVVLFAGLMWLVSISFRLYSFSLPYNLVIVSSFWLVALVITLVSAISFKSAKTTVNPTQPNNTSALVTSGIYRITRNPMYLSFSLILLGWGFYLCAVGPLLLVPLFIAYINYFQIIPEENALSKIFGQHYNHYKKNVRRWL
ncbi:methyltransferase family protein [Thalassotalea piscium]|uniref:Protein-S-isoprenylcysteine O-methyltransferase Ste14 n=1 Tax=Thalassotalea piscium TaxID=1230533 RepID=A0A7X0TSF3_9GAMM|nr:isoprenylcysteine carboxylmethyltransferase family protein [Thalassotalea piscium]MBB6542071.1 protein-S-isoprenylcysteine O-methyltransferase Ste14 [Thalassotalea piscium]